MNQITLHHPGELKVSATNPRKTHDEAGIIELALSIAKHGVIQPLIVLDNLEIIEGHRRRLAALFVLQNPESFSDSAREKASKLQCIAFDREADSTLIQTVVNVQREALNPMDEGEAFAGIMEQHRCNVSTLAEMLGKKTKHVSERLTLTKLPDSVARLVRCGKLSPKAALPIAGIPDAEGRRLAAAQLIYGLTKPKDLDEIERKASAGEIEPLLATQASAEAFVSERYRASLNGANFDLEDADLLPKAGACIGCKFRLADSGLLPEDMSQQQRAASGNVCLKPSCLTDKKEACWQRIAAKGVEFSIAKGERAIITPSSQCYTNGKLNGNLLDTMEPSGDGTTWGKRLEVKIAEYIISHPGDYTPRYLVTRAAANEALKEPKDKAKADASKAESEAHKTAVCEAVKAIAASDVQWSPELALWLLTASIHALPLVALKMLSASLETVPASQTAEAYAEACIARLTAKEPTCERLTAGIVAAHSMGQHWLGVRSLRLIEGARIAGVKMGKDKM